MIRRNENISSLEHMLSQLSCYVRQRNLTKHLECFGRILGVSLEGCQIFTTRTLPKHSECFKKVSAANEAGKQT